MQMQVSLEETGKEQLFLAIEDTMNYTHALSASLLVAIGMMGYYLLKPKLAL